MSVIRAKVHSPICIVFGDKNLGKRVVGAGDEQTAKLPDPDGDVTRIEPGRNTGFLE